MLTARPRFTSVWVTILASSAACAQAQTSQTATTPGIAARATLDKYCVTCHNQKLKTAGLTLDTLDLASIGTKPDTWEKVVRKLRAGSMPPAGSRRPDKATYDSLASWLETQLDQAASAHPYPGPSVLHRLNRTEYQNAIRDLLTLDIDASALLPGDDAAFGFDNIAELLKVSPDLLEGYLAAANKISRLAVGDKSLGLGSASYPVSQFYLQNDRMSEDLPFGSRGGAAVHHYFPYDGEYVVKIRVEGAPRPSEAIEIRVDGSRVAALETRGRSFDAPAEVGAVEKRLSLKAGPRIIGVSMIKQTPEPENRYPQYYPWGNSAVFPTNIGANGYLKIVSVDISGP